MRARADRACRRWCGRGLAALFLLALGSLLPASPAAGAARWLPATDLSPPGPSTGEPAVAMAEDGETAAVWRRQSEAGIGQIVQASVRAPGGSFSPPLELSAAASEPTLAMTPAGEAVAVWRRFEVEREGQYAIQASYRPPGGTFAAPVDIALASNASLPQDLHVAIDPSGDTVVVWTEREAKETEVVRASVRPAGGAFTEPVTISPMPVVAGSSASEPRVAIGAGRLFSAWLYEEGGEAIVQAARGTLASGFSAPQDLSSSGQPAQSPAVALGSDGSASAVWSRYNGSSYAIEATRAAAGGGFSVPSEISDSTWSAFEPELSAGPGGTETAVWTRSDGLDFLVEAAAGNAAGGFASAITLSEPGGDATRPQLDEDAGGAVTVVWQRSAGSEQAIQAAVGSAAGFGQPVELAGQAQESGFPAVAMDEAGDATAVWLALGATGEVRAAGYDADSPKLRDLSVPSRGTVDRPVSLSVLPSDAWPIASTTFQFGDGSSAEGTSVSHVYADPGVYQVAVEATDAAGSTTSTTSQLTIVASNEFAIGRLSLNRSRGTGLLRVEVPGPGRLVLSGRWVRRFSARARRAGSLKLAIVPRAGPRRALERRGALRVRLTIEFDPARGEARRKHKSVTLIKKIHRTA